MNTILMKCFKSAFAAFTLTVSTAFAAPTVSITAPANNATFVALASITINATAAASGSTVSKVDFYNGATKIGTDTTSPYSFAWTNVAVGTYTITTKATDSLGAVTTSAAITVKVNANVAPTVSITAPVNNASFIAPAAITINANAADSDGTIAKVDFYNGTTLLGTDSKSPYSYSWVSVAAGTYSITAKATDDKGAVTTSGAISITVGTNQAPTVSVTSPANNASFAAPASININANAADPDGTISKVDFYNGTTLLGTDTTSPYSYTWSNVAAGTYSITAKATDNKGAVTTSSVISISVANNLPPSITFNEPADNGPAIYAPADITLGATASDADGTITKVEFFKGSTKLGEATAAPYRYVWAAVAAGSYSLTAKATDNRGATTTSAVKALTVTANPNPASISFNMQGNAFADKSVFLTTQTIVQSISFSYPTGGGVAQRARIYANTALLCETVNATELATGNLTCGGLTLAAGTYSINAKVTGPNGAITSKTAGTIYIETTPSISAVITKPAQGEKLWAGHIDIEGSLVLPSGATFKLYRNNYPCGQNPEFDLEIPATINGSRFTAAFNWNPFQDYPPVCLRAVALATDSKRSQAFVSNIEYQQATAVVVSPTSGITVFTPTIAVEVLAAVPPNGQVVINGVTATLSGASFKATVPLITGSNEIKATVTLNGGVIATSASSYVTYTAPIDRVLTVASPTESEKRYYSNYDPAKSIITVTGSVTGIAATTVIVKDTFGSMHVADVLNGNFTANVPVSEQDNWIEVTAYGPGGATALKRVHFFVTTSTTDAIVLSSPTSCSVIPAVPANVTLSALTRSASPIVRISYLANGTVVGTSTTPPFNAQWNGVGDGSYQISAAAYKSDLNSPGGTAEIRVATSAESKITIGAPNASPTCSLLSLQRGSIYLRNASFSVEATASDPDGSVAKVDFFVDFNLPPGQAPINLYQSFTALPYKLTTGLSNPGVYTISAKATDNRGATTFCPAAQIQVSSNSAPSVSLIGPSAGTVINEGGGAIIEPGASSNVVRVQLWRGPTLLAEQTAAPFTFTLAQLAAGSYSLFARAIDNFGVSADSNIIIFSINAFPVVSINTPAQLSEFTAPANIPISVTATDADGTIQRVELYSSANLIATLTSPPYTFNWANVPAGSYSISAKAFDNVGASATQNNFSRTITVKAPVATGNVPTVVMTSPNTGATYAAPALVALQADAASVNSTISKVEFFAGSVKIGESTAAPYKYVWINAPAGLHSLSAKATDALGISSTFSTVNVAVSAATSISNVLFNGITSTTIADDSVNVSGRAIVPLNAAINVNGVLASVDAEGNFFANSILLAPGNNTIAIAINQLGSAPLVQNYTITSTAVQAFILSTSPTTAFTPAQFTVTISNPGNTPIGRVEISDGSGTPDLIYSQANFSKGFASLLIVLDKPGQATISVKAFTPSNLATPFYTGSISMRAMDPQDQAAKIQAILAQFKAKLQVNDVTGAAQFFTNTIRVQYQAMLNQLGPSMAQIVTDLSAPANISVNGAIARAWIIRQDGATRSVFNISFIQDGDGVWRIDGM